MNILQELAAATAKIRSEFPDPPDMGLVLGSGLGAFADRLEQGVSIPFGEIPGFPVAGVSGHAGRLVLGRLRGKTLAILQGRVHYYEGHSMSRVVFPVRVLCRLGINAVIMTNAAGGIRRGFLPGDLMVIGDHINFMGANPLVGPNIQELGPRFPDMSAVYDPEMRLLALDILNEMGLPAHEGVYAAMSGPVYETPAEISMLSVMGADAVGMSTVPEAMAVRHMGVRVAGFSCITNLAAGIGTGTLSHDEVKETAARVQQNFETLLDRFVHRVILK